MADELPPINLLSVYGNPGTPQEQQALYDAEFVQPEVGGEGTPPWFEMDPALRIILWPQVELAIRNRFDLNEEGRQALLANGRHVVEQAKLELDEERRRMSAPQAS